MTQSPPARGYEITTLGLPVSPGACHGQEPQGLLLLLSTFPFPSGTQVTKNTFKRAQSLKDLQPILPKVQQELGLELA